ncbi:MAG: efflux RND transporter periplasmic adaptor subunit [Acidobacteriia bacterium]|nr:efflux RND transporter periplasmic adaptor subunit [Terriglobia bacterium]
MPLTSEPVERTAPAPPAVRPDAGAPVPRRAWTRRLPLAVLAVLVLAAALVVVRPQLFPPRTSQAVLASGRIEGREVTLAPKDIQGRVKRLLADEGDSVTRGQLLAELDAAQLDARDRTLGAGIAAVDAQVAQATLDIDYTAKNADAGIAAAEAVLSGARARLIRAAAVLANAQADDDRAAALFADRVISRRERDQFETALRTSEADREAADKEVVHAGANLTLARAALDTIALKRQQLRALRQNREALLGQRAELAASLAERRIVAPADGTILSRPVEVGDVVSPGSAVFVMVDLNRLYVKVYVPEPDIPKLRLGDEADITVDAFPGRRFAARVSKISQQAEFTPKNVETTEERLKLVFGVELAFVNPDSLLKPGMPADCVIHWRASRPPDAGHGF